MTSLEDVMKAAMGAGNERREVALGVLRGDLEPERGTGQGKGPLLMRIGQAAKFLGVSHSTLFRVLRRRGVAPVELMPGTFRYRRVDMEALAGVLAAGKGGGGEG